MLPNDDEGDNVDLVYMDPQNYQDLQNCRRTKHIDYVEMDPNFQSREQIKNQESFKKYWDRFV